MNIEESILLQAMESELGLLIKVSDVELARAKLYKARKSLGADSNRLQLRLGENLGEIWILKSMPKFNTAVGGSDIIKV